MIYLFFIAFFASMLSAYLLWWGRAPCLSMIRRSDLRARQASHSMPTLRLGGLAIFFGLCSVTFLEDGSRAFLVPLLFTSLPVVVTGLLEDVGLHQAPTTRMVMAAVSGALAIWALGVAIPHVGIPFLSPLFALTPIAIAFTIFATSGIVHAFNLIDGLNGFAAFNALVVLGALLGLAGLSGDSALWLPAVALSGAVLGFLVLNYPAGRLFLGDAGAYLLGFCVAWMAVHLASTTAQLTPWAILLVLFWPVADTILSIVRRIGQGGGAAQADRLHAHHVMMRGIEIAFIGKKDRIRSNPMATALLLPLILPPPLTALLVWNKPLFAALAVGLYAILFVITYAVGIATLQRMRRRNSVSMSLGGAPAPGDVSATSALAMERINGR